MNNAEQVGKHLDELAKKQDLEKYCTFCGKCCKASTHVDVEGKNVRVLIPILPCKYLKREESAFKCSVYPYRFEVAPWCQDLFTAILHGILPYDCPYVKDLENYDGAHELSEQGYEKALPALKKIILSSPHQVGCYDPRDFQHFIDS